jgi:SET domain-containing protein
MKQPITSFEFTEVKNSEIHGFGVFAIHDIPKGTIWWRADIHSNVIMLNREQYENLYRSENNPLKQNLWTVFSTYAYYSQLHDSLVLCLDNARYVNHSDAPNSGPGCDLNPLASVALRDIKKGEEITENYDNYDPCPWAEILKFTEIEY